MNKCAFVIPLHPKHFHYGYNIITEIMNTDADLYFVFTNTAEKNIFCEGTHHHVNYVVLSDFVNDHVMSIITDNRSFVPIKKLYALSRLYHKYDYISCIDAEIGFIKKTNFYGMMKSISDSKNIYGVFMNKNNTFEISIITTTLTNVVPYDCTYDLRRISGNYKIITWWANIPVATCNLIPQ